MLDLKHLRNNFEEVKRVLNIVVKILQLLIF